MKRYVHSFDSILTQWVAETFSPALRPFFLVLTFIGEPVVTIGIGVAVMIYGLTYRSRLVWAGAMIPLTLFVGSGLKLLFERARPLTDYAANMHIKTFSFPSGHASGSMIAYGLLAYIALMKLPQPYNYFVSIPLFILPFLIGLSRVYLGAHFPSDVLAGWLLGGVMLLIVIFVIRPFV